MVGQINNQIFLGSWKGSQEKFGKFVIAVTVRARLEEAFPFILIPRAKRKLCVYIRLFSFFGVVVSSIASN